MNSSNLISIGLLLSMLVLISPASANISDRLLANNFKLFVTPVPAPNINLQDLHGRSVNLSSLRGKVVILNFWKIDCPPCSQEKPILEKIYRKYGRSGLQILAVNLIDNPEDLKTYVRDHNYSFTFAFDSAKALTLRRQNSGSMSTTFVVNSNSEAVYEIPGVPTTYVIDKNGQVVGNSVGMINWEEEPFREFLESLLAKGGSGPQNAGFDTPATNPESASKVPERRIETELEVAPSASRPVQLTDHRETSAQHKQLAQVAAPNPTIAPNTPPNPGIAPAKKKTPQGAGNVDLRKPRPFKSTQQQTLPAPTVPRPNVTAPVGGPQGGSSEQLPQGVPGSLPPLPPALPYSPQQTRRQPAPVVPDEGGSVMAQIPNSEPGKLIRPSQQGSGLPAAQPVPGRDDLSGFLLESFRSVPAQAKHPIPVRAPGQDQQAAQRPVPKPSGSIFEQVGRDVSSLGSGIKSLFGLSPNK
jgi:thiol-disulfide isomerase/thioredoxin